MASSEKRPKKDASPKKALIASVTGYAMDGFDLLILGFMLPAITIGLGLSSSEAGSLVTWTLLGAVAGGLIFGQLSDRYGRVRMLTLCILTFSIFTGLCAFAQGYWDLLIYRTLAGFGLGGEFGIGMALIAETWPANRRNRASSYVGMGGRPACSPLHCSRHCCCPTSAGAACSWSGCCQRSSRSWFAIP